MQNNNIEDDVLEKLSEITMQDHHLIKMNMHLGNDLGIDSLSMANLIAKFEDVITAHPDMNQFVYLLLNAQTVGEFCELIKQGSSCTIRTP